MIKQALKEANALKSLLISIGNGFEIDNLICDGDDILVISKDYAVGYDPHRPKYQDPASECHWELLRIVEIPGDRDTPSDVDVVIVGHYPTAFDVVARAIRLAFDQALSDLSENQWFDQAA